MKLVPRMILRSVLAVMLFTAGWGVAPASAQNPPGVSQPPAQTAAPAPIPQTPTELISQAQALEKQYQWASAVKLYAQAADLDLPSHPVQAAADLDNEANDDEKLFQYDPATALYTRALAMQKNGQDTVGQAKSLLGLAAIDEATAKDDDALLLLDSALPLSQAAQTGTLHAEVLRRIGIAYIHKGQLDKALDEYTQSLSLFQAVDDMDGQAKALVNIGICYGSRNQPVTAMADFTQAQSLFQSAGDLDGQINALKDIGITDSQRGELALSVADFNHALSLAQSAGDTHAQADLLISIGNAEVNLGQLAKALADFNEALPQFEATNDTQGLAKALLSLAGADLHLSKPVQALISLNRVLPLFEADGDKHDQALTLMNIGICEDYTSRPAAALEKYRQAGALFQKMDDSEGQADVLANTGDAYNDLSRPAKALACFMQAQLLYRSAGDADGQSNMLSDIGNAYLQLTRPAQALACFTQALPLYVAKGEINKEAFTYWNFGIAYRYLIQPGKALENYRKALSLFQATGNKNGQASALHNLGDISLYEHHDIEARRYFNQALSIFRETGDKDNQAEELTNIGNTYRSPSQTALAMACYAQALPLIQAAGDTTKQANVLTDLGNVYVRINKPSQAMAYYLQGLPLYDAAGDRDKQTQTLDEMMQASAKIPRRGRLAVMYGKQAVNLYQCIRGELSGLDQGFQQSYLKDKEPTYRFLAELLIKQHRLAEAQQVLHLLKQREFYDYLNQNPDAAPAALDTLVMTKRETKWITRYDQVTQPLERIGEEQQTLNTGNALTSEQQARKTVLDKEYIAAGAAVKSVQDETVQDFSGPATDEDTPPGVAQADQLARLLPHGTVVLDTIVGTDALHLILVTNTRAVAYTSPISAEKLYRLVYALRQDLTRPTQDPRPRAAELYKLLLGPAQKDLDRAHAKTILFSLDDALRYIPPAVLYDAGTKKYVAQTYDAELITLAAAPGARSHAAPALLGMGVSSAQEGAPPLPGVKRELATLVKDPGSPSGLVPGKMLLDATFTKRAMDGALQTRHYSWVHIASHFALHRSETDSYLLLGDGTKMTVAALRQDPHRFAGVDLLTLSACDTAMEVKASTGKEIEGFGVLAQRLGARNVVASLWPVSDTATPVLMAHLYQWRRRHPDASFAESLRKAQLSLLTRHAAFPAPSAVHEAQMRGTMLVGFDHSVHPAPAFVPDPKAPYAHPYYWAPFILIGNWK